MTKLDLALEERGYRELVGKTKEEILEQLLPAAHRSSMIRELLGRLERGEFEEKEQ